MNVNLSAKPYYLPDRQIRQIEAIIEGMPPEQRCGQMFCDLEARCDRDTLADRIKNKHIGAIMVSGKEAETVRENIRFYQENAAIPLLLASNLESGGNGGFSEGTYFGKQMEIAAAGHTCYARQLGSICAIEGRSVGINWAFAPVADIDYNFRNPITGVRTYGSNPQMVSERVNECFKAMQEAGLAACVKHFPGDGVDERDQHYVMSVNSLDCEEWNSSYGAVYKNAIDAGVLMVMAGHIALPAYEEYFTGEKIYRPATQSEHLINGLLKECLGFNGMVVTDALKMAGYCCGMKREDALIKTINSGCDMLLFYRDFEEDYHWVLEACMDGRILPERQKDALRRILGVKMRLGLFDNRGWEATNETYFEKMLSGHKAMARRCADASVTLVKDRDGLIPLSPVKYKKVLLEILGDSSSNTAIAGHFRSCLEQEGFEVYDYVPEDSLTVCDSVGEFKEKYDLVLYVGNIDDTVNNTVARVRWHHIIGMGNNIPWFSREVPVVAASLGSPYLLLDLPMVSTYINGYSNSEYVIEQIVDKLVGKSAFKGVSPVDPFCGHEDTRL